MGWSGPRRHAGMLEWIRSPGRIGGTKWDHLTMRIWRKNWCWIVDGIGAILLKGSGEGLCASPIAIGPRQPRG